MRNEFGTTADYIAAFKALERQGVHPNHRALLEAHVNARASTASWRQLAPAAGYSGPNPVKVQYGTFARDVAHQLGVRRRPRGFWLHVLADWADALDSSGHTRYTLRPEVVSALKRLGWHREKAGSRIAERGRQLHIVQGGVQNGDKDWLEQARRGARIKTWVAPKTAAVGDEAVIYIRGYGFFATARVDSPPRPRPDWKGHRYGVALKAIRLITPPISLEVIRRELPLFDWARYPRSIVTPDSATSAMVLKLVDRWRKGDRPSGVRSRQLLLDQLRAAALSEARDHVPAKPISTTRRDRSPAVHLYVLQRANGRCEGCFGRAPFRRADGSPYLEPHHVTRLSDDGADHPDNVIGLCPTCHRRVHHARDGNSYNRRLTQKLQRLVPE